MTRALNDTGSPTFTQAVLLARTASHLPTRDTSPWLRPTRAQFWLVLPLAIAIAAAIAPATHAGTGGPDAAGYRYIDSNESGGPAYNFEDISSTGTKVTGLDDDNIVGPFAIGFTFEYYASNYTNIYISSNCFLTVLAAQDDGCCDSEPIPDATNPNGIIAGWYEDVDPRVGDVYYETLGSSPNRRFIVQWSAVKLFGAPDTITLQFKLFENDAAIEVHYQQAVTDGGAFAAGIENQDGSVGLQYYRSTADMTTPVAVRYFIYPGVLSIARSDPNPNNGSSVDYLATFSESVTGVDVGDFSLASSGVTGASITGLTPVTGSTYTITVNTGTGDGTVRVDLVDDDSIASSSTSDLLGGNGAGNGDFTGQTYTIDRTGPLATAIDRLDTDPTAAAGVGFLVQFDEPVGGVDTTDFLQTTTGSLAGTSVASVSAPFGQAADLTNNPEVGGKYFNLGTDSSLEVSTFTLEAWVKYQKDGAETIVAKGDGGGGVSDYILQINKDGAGKLNLWAAGAWHNSTSVIPPNTWTHVAVTFDGSEKKFYIDGALDATATYSGSVATSGLSAVIGRQGQNSNTGYFDGLLDEVRVWNVVRSTAEIQATMDSTLIGDETGLVGYWRFEQFQNLGAGTAGTNDIEDDSPNTNHADALNSPSLTTSHSGGLAWDYIVRVETGTGSGSLGLQLADDDSITDLATNAYGGAGAQDFTTGQTYTLVRAAPTVTTTAASSIAATTAQAGGNVTSDGGVNVTARGVCWSTATSPTTSDSKSSDGTGTGAFSSTLTGLSPVTTYYVRAYATNTEGTSYGAETSFTTLAAPPTVVTTAVTGITDVAATSGGTITTDGGAAVTARGVCWSTALNPTVANDLTADGTGTGTYTSSITGLVASTTYYLRAYATNSAGTAYGDNAIFTTLAILPTVSTVAVTDITSESAMSGGIVTSDGGAHVYERGVCWNTTGDPTPADGRAENGAGIGTYPCLLPDLDPSTTYYVRAFATNVIGTAYGATVTFTTAADTTDAGTDGGTTDPNAPTAPDLRVTITPPAEPAQVGTEVAFQIAVRNVGSAPATGVTLTLPLPPNTQFVSASWLPTQTGQGVPLDASVEGDHIVVQLGNMYAGEDVAVELVLRALTADPLTLSASAGSLESPAPTEAQANADVKVEDVFIEVVNTFIPVHTCGALGLSPLLVALGLIGWRSRLRPRRST